MVGDSNTGEGKSADHPIVLEGYKAEDFQALLMVLYPTTDDIVVGKLTLTKEQWIGVLRLSRPWEMHKIRKLAISTLSSSTFVLTAVEKVTLARDHKVAAWLVEGLSGLTFGEEARMSPDALEEAVGTRTAFRVARIQAELAHSATVIPVTNQGTLRTEVNLTALRCVHCEKPLVVKTPFACEGCNEGISVGWLNISSFNVSIRGSEFQFGFSCGSLYCKSCQRRVVSSSFCCASCSRTVVHNHTIWASLSSVGSSDALSGATRIREVFADEIREYDG